MLEGSHYLTLGGRSKPNHLCSHRICHIFELLQSEISQSASGSMWPQSYGWGEGEVRGELCVMLCGLGSQRNCWGMVRPGNFPLSSECHSQIKVWSLTSCLPLVCSKALQQQCNEAEDLAACTRLNRFRLKLKQELITLLASSQSAHVCLKNDYQRICFCSCHWISNRLHFISDHLLDFLSRICVWMSVSCVPTKLRLQQISEHLS